MELKDRLAYIMERRSIPNAAELSRMTGLTQVAIRNYMRGIKVPNAQALVKLARSLNTTTDYLLYGTPLRHDRIPLLSRIPGGKPLFTDDQSYPTGFGEEFLDRGDVTDPQAYALVVEGNSMSPRINSGDVVIISPNSPVINRTHCGGSYQWRRTNAQNGYFFSRTVKSYYSRKIRTMNL